MFLEFRSLEGIERKVHVFDLKIKCDSLSFEITKLIDREGLSIFSYTEQIINQVSIYECRVTKGNEHGTN